MLLKYGKLKSFHLPKENQIDASRGFAFCEFVDEEGLNKAMNFLNGMKIGTRTISIRRSGSILGNTVQ